MKKIGIITLNGYFNYGNRLQNYALQEVLRSLGFHVETILIDNNTSNTRRKNINLISKIKKIKGMKINKIFEKTTFKLWYYTHKNKIKKYNNERVQRFIKFTHDHILETKYCISDNKILNDLANSYDYFVTGSDQVWNPRYNKGSSIYFLTFAPKIKRVAYSPSFGLSSIPTEYLENYKTWISEMASISVREEAGARTIKKLTGRDAPVLIDPTLVLSKGKWLSIAKHAPNKPKKRYLLTYFLGEGIHNHKDVIKQIALENKLEIVNLANIKDFKAFITCPSEFIDYINSASMFFTDSFHGCVFSILLEKPFIVFDRIENGPSMNSRIDTLLSTFNLQSRKWENIKDKKQVFDIDYSHVQPILEIERQKAFNYLKEALNVKDEDKL
ncbi:hypothetical protein JOC70_001318 [Clostridium pascui]|uniref:polysaccharide pyruvyl transferase family protein n=1 Tax=Clostridium pascui TaxID=46609 RepID=UPI0019584AA2|nr:polysaccharide pyruvyl transferase family protein [Clostridium pascui]MBM7869848.1 hypothetical protein [Clostridium pascui]